MDIRPTVARYDLWSQEIESEECDNNGSIQLEANAWSLIAVPINQGWWNSSTHMHVHDTTTAKIKNYVIDQIDDLYGTGKILVANAYLGDNQYFYSYVPGVTPESSVHNFQLIYTDGIHNEITGFWIYSQHSSDIEITWGDIT